MPRVMSKLPVPATGKRVLTLETAQQGATWSWVVFNSSAERLATGADLPDEPAAQKAAKSAARKLLFDMADGLRPVPP